MRPSTANSKLVVPRSSAHLPVSTWPKIIKASKSRPLPTTATPVPRRATGRRVELKIRSYPRCLTVPVEEYPVQSTVRRRPPTLPLKIGKRPNRAISRARPPGTIAREKIQRKTVPRLVRSGPSFGPMQQAQGKEDSRLMKPSACVDFHPFAETLREWETGVPVDCGAPWAWETIEAAVEKGAHKSATSEESIALIAEDVAYQVAAGYAEVILWDDL